MADGANTTLVGGTGNETLIVNNSTTVVQVTAGVGHDSLYSSVSYSVPANLTALTLTGTANITAYANSGNDVITANSGADGFVDGVGVDTLIGGPAGDSFSISNSNDVVIASPGNAGSSIGASVSYSLPSYVDVLNLSGTANLSATGNSDASNTIRGNQGSDILTAGSGTDMLTVGYDSSANTLIGGSGDDSLFAGTSVGDSLVSGRRGRYAGGR